MAEELTEELFYDLVKNITSGTQESVKWSKITETKEGNLTIEWEGGFMMTGNPKAFWESFDKIIKEEVNGK